MVQLQAWSHASSAGFTLRGWHSPPSGKPLLHVLHGNGFCGRVYEPMLAHLAEHFDLWLCDAPGHGNSDAGEPFVGWNRCAELAVEAFEAGRGLFGEVPRYALGHSFGGVLSCLILARHPGLFQRVVLLDPVIFPPKLLLFSRLMQITGLVRSRALIQQTLRRRASWPSREDAERGLQGRGIYRNWTPEALRAFVEHALLERDGQVELKCRPSREAEIFGSSPRRLWWSIRRVSTPTHIVHGARSYPFVAEAAKRCVALNRHFSEQQVAGGHCFMQEDPQMAADAALAFLLRS
jgi:pimeloyl-ACP methyl ester carboxylesterase